MKVLIALFYRKQFRCFASGLAVGILAGAAVFSLLVSYRMDQYYQEIRQLEAVNEEKETRLRRLEQSVGKTKYLLKKIEVSLIYEGDELDKIDLEKSIQEKYSQLLGKEVGGIDIDLVAGVIDGRIVKLEEREYQLELKKMMLADVLKIWVKVSLIE
ncbi:MAG: hypothetical protein ACM3YE_11095 [Bacteroidota bacterium]